VKRLVSLAFLAVLAVGCGKKGDLNKDLKPVDGNAPRPVPASENPGGQDPTTVPKAEKPSPVIE